MLNLAIIGMGGFAGAHHRAAKTLEEEGRCRLICTCDPAPEAFSDFSSTMDFEGRAVKIYDDYLAMLDAHRGEIDVVSIPTPVPLHAEMHREAVQRGIAVYLEKPPTLNHVELAEMLTVEEDAVKATNVGFNYIVEPARRKLKQRILDGEFGSLRRCSFYGVWPRGEDYFGRARWAGKLILDSKLVMDSCMGNACSHFIHNLLFWSGKKMDAWGVVRSTTAELYRAHRIQSFDTVFAKGLTEDNVQIRVAITHAIAPDRRFPGHHQEFLECEEASILYTTGFAWEVHWHDGRRESGSDDMDGSTKANFRAYFDYVEGTAARPVTRLIDTLPYVHFYNQVFLAADHITTIGDQVMVDGGWQNGDGIVSHREIEHAIVRYHYDGFFPSEVGYSWAAFGGSSRPSKLPELDTVVRRMADAAMV